MTCLDQATLDEAAELAAEIAVFEPQQAAELLRVFRLRWRAWAYYWDRATGEERVGEAWLALIETHDRLMDAGANRATSHDLPV